MGFTLFDMIIIGITLLLGLKGLFRGIIKEVFGIVGIVGAIFIGSRFSKETGDLIAPILGLENGATINLIGFAVTLVGFWLVIYFIGEIVSKMFAVSGLGIVDRIFGFLFGSAKVFLIFSVITYAIYQVQSFKKTIDEKAKDSIVIPHLISVGSYIIKIDTVAITEKIENSVNNVSGTNVTQALKSAQETVKTTTENVSNNIKEEAGKQLVEEVKKEIQPNSSVEPKKQ